MDLLSENIKQALFVVIALHLPTDQEISTATNQSWSRNFLLKLTIHLDVSDSYVDGYMPFIAKIQESQSNEDRKIALSSFLELVDAEVHRNVYLLMEIVVFLLVNKMYDGRGRSLVCNLLTMKTIIISGTSPLVSIEYSLIQTIQELKEKNTNSSSSSSSSSQKYDNQNSISATSSRSQMIRYAQIGVVTLGAGALLALTGGLAAPAVAAAVVGMGGSATLAAVFSFTFMASVFGTAGASLAAYRMDKRTKGLKEFIFEKQETNPKGSSSNCDNSSASKAKADLSVVIAVSGWMTQSDEDYQRTFGIVPTHTHNISLYERLYRFYRVNDSSHLSHVNEESMLYTDSSGSSRTMEPNRLYRKLRTKYPHVDPLKREDLIMPAYIPRLLNISCRMYLSLIVERLLLQQQLIQYQQRMMEFTDSTEQTAEQQRIKDQIATFDRTNDLITKCGYRKKPQPQHNSNNSNNPSQVVVESATYIQLPPPVKPAHRPSKPMGATADTTVIQADNFLTGTASNKQSSATAETALKLSECKASTNDESSVAITTVANTTTSSIVTPTAVIIKTLPAAAVVQQQDQEISPSTLYWDWNDLPLSCTHEYYLLRWETQLQLELGTLVEEYMKSIRDYVVQNIIENLFFYSLASAVAIPAALLNVTKMVDGGVWNIAIHRADLAGRELAKAILAQHIFTPSSSNSSGRTTSNVLTNDVSSSNTTNASSGTSDSGGDSTTGSGDTRPLTLIGFSIGARVIFACLKELATIRFRQIRRERSRHKKKKSSAASGGVTASATRRVSAVVSAVRRMKASSSTNKTTTTTHSLANHQNIDDNGDESNEPDNVNATSATPINNTDDTEGFYDSDFDFDDGYDDDLATAIANSNIDTAGYSTGQNNNENLYNINENDDDDEDIDTAAAEEEASINRFIDSKIHNVILLGTPVAATNRHWKAIRRLVNGRLINGYSTSDLMLGIIYRAQRIQVNVAGLTEVHIPYDTTTSTASTVPSTMIGISSSVSATVNGATSSVVTAVKSINQSVSYKANNNSDANNSNSDNNVDPTSSITPPQLVHSATVTTTTTTTAPYYGDIENVDLTDIVKQHTDYSTRMKDILDRIDLK